MAVDVHLPVGWVRNLYDRNAMRAEIDLEAGTYEVVITLMGRVETLGNADSKPSRIPEGGSFERVATFRF